MSETDKEVLRNYLAENEFLVSPEGILKVLSIVVSVISGSLWLTSPCLWGRYTGAVGAGAAVGGALVVTVVCVLRVAAKAPYFWFNMDIVVSSASGVLLLVAAMFSFTICDLAAPVHYVYGPLSLLAAALITSSAVVTYITVSGRWETAAARVRVSAKDDPPAELDV